MTTEKPNIVIIGHNPSIAKRIALEASRSGVDILMLTKEEALEKGISVDKEKILEKGISVDMETGLRPSLCIVDEVVMKQPYTYLDAPRKTGQEKRRERRKNKKHGKK